MYADQPLHRYAFWVIFIGMGLRILWALAMPVNPVSDSVAYDTFARNLAQHGVYGWTQDESVLPQIILLAEGVSWFDVIIQRAPQTS